MGILDEAIREHLELKRAHGASEDEVREQEKEALGPPSSTLPPAPVEAEPVEPPPYPEPDIAEPALEEEPYDLEAGLEEHGAYEPEPATSPDEGLPESGSDDEELPDEDAGPAPAEDAGPAPAEDAGPAPAEDFFEDEPFSDDEPRPGTSPDEGLPESGEDDPDLLEETPEFLQESPDQERLWFEQRPPKDFDFDDD